MPLRDNKAIQTFFGLFDRPVHVAELLWYKNTFSLEDVFLLEEILATQRSFHATFNHRYRAATRKWRRAQRVAGWLQLFPWIHGVGIGNTLAYLNVHETSDIDLFVVSAPRRLWLTRLTVTGLLRVLRWRPNEGQQDPVCPSFYVSSDVESFAEIAIEDDIYLHMWLATLVVLWEREGIFSAFFVRNSWALNREHVSAPVAVSFWKKCCVKLLALCCDWDWVEQFAKYIQMRLLPDELKRKAVEPDTAVVLSETMLKFHTKDRRAKYRDQFLDAYGTPD